MTRWNSTFIMLQSALEFRPIFDKLRLRDAAFMTISPAFEDWEKAEILSSFLKVFHDATLRFSSYKSPTSNVLFHEVFEIQSHLRVISNNEHVDLRDMGRKMQLKFDKYWKEIKPIFAIALLLDPRYKMVALRYFYKELYPTIDVDGRIEEILCTMKSLFLSYEVEHELVSSSSDTGSSSSRSYTEASRSTSSYFGVGFLQMLKKDDGKGKERMTELDEYLGETIHPTSVDCDVDAFDILDWWRVNSKKYPIVANMARDILAIPTSTVASESAFSTGGRVLDQFRSSLSPDVVQALICAQDWMRGSRPCEAEADQEIYFHDSTGLVAAPKE